MTKGVGSLIITFVKSTVTQLSMMISKPTSEKSSKL